MLPTSPDRYRMCAACPSRHQADFYEEMGAGEIAETVRQAGCPDWVDRSEGFVGLSGEDTDKEQLLEGCGRKAAFAIMRLHTREAVHAGNESARLKEAVQDSLREPAKVLLLPDDSVRRLLDPHPGRGRGLLDDEGVENPNGSGASVVTPEFPASLNEHSRGDGAAVDGPLNRNPVGGAEDRRRVSVEDEVGANVTQPVSGSLGDEGDLDDVSSNVDRSTVVSGQFVGSDFDGPQGEGKGKSEGQGDE